MWSEECILRTGMCNNSGPSLKLKMHYDAVLLVSIKVICPISTYNILISLVLWILDDYTENWITYCKTQGNYFRVIFKCLCEPTENNLNTGGRSVCRYSPVQSCASVADPCSLNTHTKKEKLFHLLCLTIPCLCFPFCHFSITLVLFFGWAGSGAEASPFPSDSHISLFLLVPLESVQTEAEAWGNQPGTTAC